MGKSETRANLSEGLRRGWKKYRKERVAVAQVVNRDPARRAKISATLKAIYGDSTAPGTWTPEQKEARAKVSDGVKSFWAALTPQDRKLQVNHQMRGCRTPQAAALRRPALKASHARRKEDLQQLRIRAWRPADWDTKPTDWRIIGNELLSKDYMSNVELGQRLDDSRLLRCPYGECWEGALSSNKQIVNRAAVKLVNEIRGWVNRPGKTGVRKNPVNH